MDITGLEKIKLVDLQEVFKLNKLPMKEAIPEMIKFRDRRELDDKTALRAFGVAKRIFEA